MWDNGSQRGRLLKPEAKQLNDDKRKMFDRDWWNQIYNME